MQTLLAGKKLKVLECRALWPVGRYPRALRLEATSPKCADFERGTKRGRNRLKILGPAGKMAARPRAPRALGLRSKFSIRRQPRRRLGHQMQIRSRPGMRERDLLVQFDAEPGLVGRDDETVLPADRLFEDRAVEAVPALDALEDEKIRAAGC